ncbi:probable glycosyltransferase At3g07620 [Typha angustifolia]|uniref:probable glycosyltransferase At3g07620 n=1 Tax=Typha angustifolia TaxID=59011 RepID=UPI003C2B78A3
MARSQKPSLLKSRRWVRFMVIILFAVMLFESSKLHFRIALLPPFPDLKFSIIQNTSPPQEAAATSLPLSAGKLSLVGDTGSFIDSSKSEGTERIDGESENDDESFTSKKLMESDGYVSESVGNSWMVLNGDRGFNSTSDGEEVNIDMNQVDTSLLASTDIVSYDNEHVEEKLGVNSSDHFMAVAFSAPSGEQAMEVTSGLRENNTPLKDEATISSEASFSNRDNNATLEITVPPKRKKNKKKSVVPPIYISEMNQLLLRNRASYRSVRPLWPSAPDREILAAKAEIENAALVKEDRELYAPIYRNISMFKRSYKLMEEILKVYVYKEGEKPILHLPLLKGIYASEGWFMKQMESSKRFVVTNPAKAHMFYLPYSSCILRFHLYQPSTHNMGDLEWYLRNYLETIAAKYPFWNRTMGADHFLAACHDWAPSQTKRTMEHPIRALCSADLHNGFQLGKDISLLQSAVRYPKNPLRELGGMPANRRPTLAFFAGNTHGGLRGKLLQYWENKDPDMKIYGPTFRWIRSNMTYKMYMKSSKYCICPRGYEVNSPRLVESIFYECVPVIIADNYVPPFFEVLNWEAFSVIIPEKDVHRLKELLLSIPREKYRALQMGVRKVQKHFLWHNKPVKYDAFHMILHSVWSNRVFSI